MLCGKLIRSDSMITFVRRHHCVHSEIATSCIVGDHASYMQMSAPCMEISGSTRVASTAERPDGDVALCRIPNKEIVGRILLAYMTMSSEYGSKGGDAI